MLKTNNKAITDYYYVFVNHFVNETHNVVRL